MYWIIQYGSQKATFSSYKLGDVGELFLSE